MLSTIGIKVDTSALVNAEGKLQNLENAIARLATSSAGTRSTSPARASGNLKLKFRANATRKMRNVVLAVAQEIAKYLNHYTIIGDADKIDENSPRFSYKYAKMYADRERKYGIEQQVGYHKGAYSYTESIRGVKNREDIRTLAEMQSELKSDFSSQYTLGDTFYISANGPAYHLFERNIIGEPVLKPTLKTVMSTYRAVAEAAYARRAY